MWIICGSFNPFVSFRTLLIHGSYHSTAAMSLWRFTLVKHWPKPVATKMQWFRFQRRFEFFNVRLHRCEMCEDVWSFGNVKCQTYAAHSYSYSIMLWTWGFDELNSRPQQKCAHIVPFTHISPIYHPYINWICHPYPGWSRLIQVDPGWSRLIRGTQRDARATLLAFLQRRFRQVWWRDVGKGNERSIPCRHTHLVFTGNSHWDHWVALTNLFDRLSTSSQLEMASRQTQANPCVKDVRWSYTRNVAQIITASHSLPCVSQGGAEHETILLQAVEEVCAEEAGTLCVCVFLWWTAWTSKLQFRCELSTFAKARMFRKETWMPVSFRVFCITIAPYRTKGSCQCQQDSARSVPIVSMVLVYMLT